MPFVEDSFSGGYQSGFFSAHIRDSNVFPAINPLNDSTVYHEFVHYLQDVYTRNGNLRYIYLWDIVEKIQVRTRVDFKLNLGKNLYEKINKWKRDESFEFPLDFDDCKYGKVTFKDFSRRKGKMAITLIEESMADLMESKTAFYKKNDEYPYTVVESLFRHKTKTNKKNVLIWICFLALNCIDPCYAIYMIYKNYDPSIECGSVEVFLSFIEKNKKEFGFDWSDIQLKRNKAFQRIKKLNFTGFQVSIKVIYSMQLYNHSCINGFKELLEYFSIDPQNEKLEFEKKTAKIGLPIYYDNNGIYQSFGRFVYGDNSILGYICLEHMFFLWLNKVKDRACPLIATCGYVTDLFCKKKPWDYVRGTKGCTYSVLWKLLRFPSSKGDENV